MIGNDWDEVLQVIWNSNGFKHFYNKIMEEYDIKTIYPPKDYIFNALKLTSYENTKVVIVGQDPYHGENQAHGLSFSVQKGIKLPPSLQNIYKELESDLGIKPRLDGDLTGWAKQGVLLLNTVLTVRKGMANSHKDKGWEKLTRKIIELLGQRKEPIVFLLWGSYAQSYQDLIAPWHLVLKAPHPSPLSAYRGFFGCKHFSKCNHFLVDHGQTPIDWR